MSRYLITGAFGHIGAFLLRQLLESGEAVTILVRESSDPWRVRDLLASPHLRILRADMNDSSAVRAALSEARPEVVIHSAWEGVTGAARNDTTQITHNVTATLQLFEVAREVGVGTFVGIGSQAEYGTAYTEPRQETMSPRPDTAYGVAKACAQMATEKMAQLVGIRYLWFRVFSVYGPQDDERHMVPGLIRALLRGERPALTPGEQRWDYLHIDDVAGAILSGVRTESASGIFNVASGRSDRLRSVVEAIRDRVDPDLLLGFGDVPYRPDQVMLLEADISRITTITGWAPQISLSEGLRRTVDYYRSYPTAASERDITQ